MGGYRAGLDPEWREAGLYISAVRPGYWLEEKGRRSSYGERMSARGAPPQRPHMAKWNGYLLRQVNE